MGDVEDWTFQVATDPGPDVDLPDWTIAANSTGGFYKSLTGPGETETPGALTQAGDFTVDGGLIVNSIDGVSIIDDSADGITILETNGGTVQVGNTESSLTIQGDGVVGLSGLLYAALSAAGYSIEISGGSCIIQTTDLTFEGTSVYLNLPTADPHAAGKLWNNGGIVTVSSG